MHPFHVPIYIKKKLKDFVEEFRTLLRLVLSFFACQITKIDIYININPWDLFFSCAITRVINGDSFIFPVPFRNVAKVSITNWYHVCIFVPSKWQIKSNKWRKLLKCSWVVLRWLRITKTFLYWHEDKKMLADLLTSFLEVGTRTNPLLWISTIDSPSKYCLL